MINPKQRAYLKSLAHELEPVVIIGKGGISANLIKQIDGALEARELIKIKILNNNTDERDELVEVIMARTKSQFVQLIGSVLIVYRESKKNRRIILPTI